MESIWPNDTKIEIIGLTGDFASGKTLFALTIDPENTRIYDTETSASTYTGFGFDHVDIPKRVHEAFKGKPYQPMDLFEWWHKDVMSVEPGKYSVIVLDTVSEIETGLAERVRNKPEEYGLTADQAKKSAPLLWGKVKDAWKQILLDIQTRCQTFVFTSHLRSEFKGATATGRKQPKGKETLMELAALYLWLERKPNKGVIPDVPSANVVKSRLADARMVDGKPQIVNLLPPRLPHATPDEIRKYILTPPNPKHLKASEKVQEEKLSDDDKLILQNEIAQAQREAEENRVKHLELVANAGARAAKRREELAKQNGQQDEAPAASSNSHVTIEAPFVPDAQNIDNGKANREQLEALKSLKGQLRIPNEQWKVIMEKCGVTTAVDLTPAQAEEVITKLRGRL